jgi:hypothetical protein
MKTMKIVSSATLALLASTQLLAGAAFAESTVSATDNSNTLDSKAQVVFTPSNAKTPIVDPTSPDTANPVTPKDNITGESVGNTGLTQGPLSIDYASSLNFGSHQVSSLNQTYYAQAQEFADGSKGPDYVQVTDNTGSNSGWTLTVTEDAAGFTDGSSGNAGSKLKGAVITLPQGTLATTSGSNAGTPKSSGATLVEGAASKIVTADANQGQGTWVNAFGATSDYTDTSSPITLSVPGSSTKNTSTPYTTTLTWNLQQTPTN